MFKLENFRIFSYDKIIIEIDDFKVDSGKSVLIVGKNSTGKTLILETIKLQYTEYSGGIFLRNKEIHLTSNSDSIYIESISQLIEERSVWENLTLAIPKLTKRMKEKILQLTEIVGIKEKIDTKVKFISRAEKKKVEIVRAVALLPYLIIIDDIDSFFDEESLVGILKILNIAKKSGANIILTSKVVFHEFDEILRIQSGKIERL